jgi:colanic acid biosynthesis glycosyl transferase WcaI
MHILIITPNYNPDLGPSAPLFTMLSQGLKQRGHAVTVITAVPHYPSGQVSAEYRGKLFRQSDEQGVKVIRVGLPSVKRQSLPQRMVQFIIFQLSATLAQIGLTYDAVIAANPAIQVWLPFTWARIVRRKPVIFSVHDVYPDVGITLGIFKSRAQIALVGWLERFCLSHASFVRILSGSFRASLQRRNIPGSKIALIYDWVDTELIQPQEHDNPFAQQYKLSHDFVVMYAGNIGLSQGLEHILSSAELLAENTEMRFVFVGNGTGLETLQNQATQMKLQNVHFIPFQPRERLPQVLASADISVVIIRPGIGSSSLPSKIYSIMASGRPILISVDEKSEAWGLIQRAGAGMWVDPENPSGMAEGIMTLKQDSGLRDRLGRNGRRWVLEHHSAQHAAEQFELLLKQAIGLR